MMKGTIFISFILCVLTSTHGDSIFSTNECQNIPVKENFDTIKFLNRPWYVTNMNKSSDPTDVCQESKSKLSQDGSVDFIISSYSKVRKPEFVRVECKGNVNSVKISGGKVIFHCNIVEAPQIGKYQMEISAVETDYDNFGIFYICSKDGDKVLADNLVVVSRNEVQSTDARIAETIKKLGLNFEKFSKRKDANCKVNPEFSNQFKL